MKVIRVIFSYLRSLLFILIQIAPIIMSIPPEIAISTIAKWLLVLGINTNNIPNFLFNPCFNKVLYFLSFLIILRWLSKIVPLKKLFSKIKTYKSIKNFDFISLHDAIAKIIQFDINQLWNEYKFDDYTIYPHLRYKKCDRIESIELLTIFALIQEGKLILYAHKIIDSGHNYIDTSHLPLQQIPKEFFKTCDIYSKNTWMDNYTIIRNFYATEEYYVNVSMKREELDCFIKEHKLLVNL